MENNAARVENSISLIFLMVDSLRYDKNYWIVFLVKYPFISKKYANYQSPLKSSFDAQFY